MNEQKKFGKKLWMRILIVALCLVMAFGTTVTIMASSFNGDLDGDGKITAFDAQLLAEYQAGNRDLDPATVIGLTIRGILDRVFGKIVDDPTLADGIEKTFEVKAEEGVVTKTETFTFDMVTVTVSEGTKVNGAELTVTVKQKDASEGGITLEDGQELLPLDIHVEGVAADNTAPIVIRVAEALETGMNLGNLTLYHVENGEPVAMTQVMSAEELTAHNQFYYDPATGDIAVSMATFSEVTVVSDTAKGWEGNVAAAFAGGTGVEKDPYLIANADQLAYMSQLVSTNEAAAAAHYKLISDINMNGDVAQKNDRKDLMFYPIGYWAQQVDENGAALKNSAGEEYYGRGNTFTGVFDGNGNTIANIYQNTWLMDGTYDYGYWNTAMGLFGAVYGTTIKNLTMDNFQCDGETAPVGCIATYAGGPDMLFENIQLTNCNPRTYNVACGGIAGYNYNSTSGTADEITFRNITVDQTNKITALWGSYGVSGGSLLGRLRENSRHDGTNNDGQFNHVVMENCHMATVMDVNNDCCSNYQWYLYCYAGMVIGTVDYIDEVPGVGIEDVVTATKCTVTYGDWNRYWYCELVKNTIASYTHDHQFGRLTEIDSVDEIQDEEGHWNKEGGFVTIDKDNNVECYHIFKNSAGELYRHFHNVADESNPSIYEEKDINGDGELNDLKEDHQRYFIPFNQLWIGYNRGCKPMYEFDGIKIVEGGTVKSSTKFAAKAVDSVETDATVKLSDLFTSVEGANISQSTVNVFVSPVGEDSTVAAEFNRDNSNWGDGTLSFTGKGVAKIVITDYYYCTETVLTVTVGEQQPADKFVAESVKDQVAGAEIKLGDLFSVKDGAIIDSANVQVTVTVNEGVEYTYTPNDVDWTLSTLKIDKVGGVTVTINDQKNCNDASVTFMIAENPSFATVLPRTDILYRVGNANTIALGKLFTEVDGATINSDVTVSATTLVSRTIALSGNFSKDTWKTATIDFNDTYRGPVQLTIDAVGAEPYTLLVEVVNGNNITANSNGILTGWTNSGSNVLLENVAISSNGTLILANGTLFGNGFTLDARNAAYAGVDMDYKSYVISMSNANMDNVVIEGKVYPSLGITKEKDYYRPLVFVTDGDCQIANSYLSNTASPIRTGANLELINTTLKGGAYANLDMRGGQLILDNVTTINQVNGNEVAEDGTVVVGMGIVVYQEGGTDAMSITIRNNLTQYNYLSEAQADAYITDTYGSLVTSTMFDSEFVMFQYNDGSTKWVNTGIISMNNFFTEIDLHEERTSHNYNGVAKEISKLGQSRNCYVYTIKPTAVTTPGKYEIIGQYEIAPDAEPDFENKNYLPKEEGKNDYCIADKGEVYISMDVGDTFNWDTDILKVTKNEETIPIVSVTMNGVDYKGKSIAFSQDGTYYVAYTYSDPGNYTVDAQGNISTYSKTYTKTIVIHVVTVEAAAKHAEFSFGANGTAYTGRTEQIGDRTYVMPDVYATVSGKIGSTTVNGKTVYYPITEMYTSDGKTAHTGSWYACFPIFKDALQIVDYADKGTGDPVTYNQTKVTTVAGIPSTLKAVDPQTAFRYSMNATTYPAPTDPTAVSNAVCYTCNRSGLTSSNTRDEMTIIAEYTYTDNAGQLYYYYIGYHCAKQTKGSVCVTSDTMVTLADGSQKRVDEITNTDNLLVWNFYTGKYDVAPAAIVFYHGDKNYEVLKLNFADKTSVKVIINHGFYHVGSNDWVYIDKDNVESYVGEEFVKVGANGPEHTKLVSYEVIEEYTGSYSIQTAQHINFVVEGMFSITFPPYDGWFDYFEIGEDMKYDEAKMQADIAKYGLYTYEDFAEYVTYEQFIAFNGPYLKVLVGRGVLTYYQILELIAEYVAPMN